MEKRNNKNKKRLLILVALVGVMGIGGVVAATSITINSGAPLSLGAGYAAATTCDTDIAIATTQSYSTSTNKYEVSTFTITGVDPSYTIAATGLGCANKTMSLAYVTGTMASSTSPGSATWTLPSIATSYGSTTNYIYGNVSNSAKGVHNTSSQVANGQTFYSYAQLTAFDVSTLLTVALSIS